jgi:hypothetical protein
LTTFRVLQGCKKQLIYALTEINIIKKGLGIFQEDRKQIGQLGNDFSLSLRFDDISGLAGL